MPGSGRWLTEPPVQPQPEFRPEPVHSTGMELDLIREPPPGYVRSVQVRRAR